MPYDVITIGSAVRDTFLFFRPGDILVLNNPESEATRRKLLALEYGAKINVKKSAVTLGGGALNSAVTFSRLGFKTATAVSLGCDESAEAVVSALRREKIGSSLVAYHSRRHTGFSVLLVEESSGEHAALVERGANDGFNFLPGKNVGSARWYYVSPLTGLYWPKVLDKLVKLVRGEKSHWAWNPGHAQIEAGVTSLKPYLKHCTVLILNHDEALGLLRAGKGRNDNIKLLLSRLLKLGPKMVVITDGAGGAYYADNKEMLFIAPDSKLKVVESTGAGDGFGSGFVAGLLLTKSKDVHYALELAMCNAESVISQIGAQAGILRKEEIKKIMGKGRHKIRKLSS